MLRCRYLGLSYLSSRDILLIPMVLILLSGLDILSCLIHLSFKGFVRLGVILTNVSLREHGPTDIVAGPDCAHPR